MKNAIYIIGAGGHAKVAIASAEAAGFAIAGIFDDDPAKSGTILLGHAVSGPVPPASWWEQRSEGAHLAIGSNRARQRLALLSCRWVSIVHPSAYVHATAKIGAGTLVCARAVIHPDAVVGSHSIVNTAAVVEHDCLVEDFVHLAPMSCLAGGAQAGEGAFIGMGASVIPETSIGTWAMVGAGAAVINDVADGATVAGTPARPLRS